jgi:hypothetical protein
MIHGKVSLGDCQQKSCDLQDKRIEIFLPGNTAELQGK